MEDTHLFFNSGWEMVNRQLPVRTVSSVCVGDMLGYAPLLANASLILCVCGGIAMPIKAKVALPQRDSALTSLNAAQVAALKKT